MAVLMGRLDGGTPARIFASLIFFRIHFLGGPAAARCRPVVTHSTLNGL